MQQVTTVGLDLAKNLFQVHGADAQGRPVLKRRLAREKVLEFFANLPPCLVGLEACAAAQPRGRARTRLGREDCGSGVRGRSGRPTPACCRRPSPRGRAPPSPRAAARVLAWPPTGSPPGAGTWFGGPAGGGGTGGRSGAGRGRAGPGPCRGRGTRGRSRPSASRCRRGPAPGRAGGADTRGTGRGRGRPRGGRRRR